MKIFFLSLFLCVSLSWGQDAWLNKFKGNVEISDAAQKKLKPYFGLPMHEGYSIKTSENSECEILFKDKSVIFVSENSHFDMEKIALTGGKRDFSINFIKGKILFFVQKMVNSAYKVKTPIAVCAVRGTDFSVIVSSVNSSIGLFEGTLDVEAKGEKKEMNPGNQADIGESFTISKRLSLIMEKERVRAEKLKKYVENIRAKLEKREKALKDREEKINKKLSERKK
ncbi:MAG: FecR domain-containing protein [Elusimicrobia bacterium]|nr:FecR domain-containing protein [Elusimicrobiota bacterium]